MTMPVTRMVVDRRRPDSRGSVGRPPRQRLTKPDTTVGNWRRRRRSHNTAHGRASSHQFSDLEGGRPADRPSAGRWPATAAPRRAALPSRSTAKPAACRRRSSSARPGNCVTPSQRVRRHINGRFAVVAERPMQMHATRVRSSPHLLLEIFSRALAGPTGRKGHSHVMYSAAVAHTDSETLARDSTDMQT